MAKDPNFGSIINQNNTGGSNPRQQGVFGLNPLSTPKYAQLKPRDSEFIDTMARLYVAIPPKSVDAYLASLPKDQQTQALAKVLLGAGQTTPSGFVDFFLQQANEAFTEKMQVDEVIADNYVAFFFGQNAPVFQYSGMLLNTQQDDQRIGFGIAYQNLMRGSKLAQQNAVVRLRYDSVIVEGAITNTSQVLNADNEMAVPFNFSLLVKSYIVTQPASQFRKISTAQYVQLTTPFLAGTTLGKNIARASDVRVRTTMVTSPSLADESVAGQEEASPVGDPEASAPYQLMSEIQTTKQPIPATDAIRGTVTSTAPPPPPLVTSLNGFET